MNFLARLWQTIETKLGYRCTCGAEDWNDEPLNHIEICRGCGRRSKV